MEESPLDYLWSGVQTLAGPLKLSAWSPVIWRLTIRWRLHAQTITVSNCPEPGGVESQDSPAAGCSFATLKDRGHGHVLTVRVFLLPQSLSAELRGHTCIISVWHVMHPGADTRGTDQE
jgi:hypothetical protein